jgi:hypothetical protein
VPAKATAIKLPCQVQGFSIAAEMNGSVRGDLVNAGTGLLWHDGGRPRHATARR